VQNIRTNWETESAFTLDSQGSATDGWHNQHENAAH